VEKCSRQYEVENKAEPPTAVLQDLGDSYKLKLGFVPEWSEINSKNWEGFPQTLQSHKTLVDILRNTRKSKTFLKT